jgi:hypothetical protein
MILAGVDSMINILGHEIAETVSDPENAWLDASGAENAGTLQYVKLTAIFVSTKPPSFHIILCQLPLWDFY